MKKILITLCALLITATATAQEQYERYIISPGDTLEISVWKDESLSRTVIVPPDGVVSFPLIGDIDSRQMTVTDLRESVTQKLLHFIPEVTATVMLQQFSIRAYVIGKVARPGAFPIMMDTDVMQILSIAGGLNPYADEKHIHILRREDGATVKLPFNYKEVLKGKNLAQNILLKRGDVVVVP